MATWWDTFNSADLGSAGAADSTNYLSPDLTSTLGDVGSPTQSTPASLSSDLGYGNNSTDLTSGLYTGDASGAAAGNDWLSQAISSVTSFADSGLQTLDSWAKQIFTEPAGTKTTRDPVTGEITTQTTGGGISSLGKQLIAGAIQGLGSSYVAKWQAQQQQKMQQNQINATAAENQKQRDFEAAQQAEKYRRMAYGENPAPTNARAGLIASRTR